MPTRRGATTVTARRGPHLVDGSGTVVTGGGVSGLVQPRPLPPRSSQTKFVSDRGLLKRLDLVHQTTSKNMINAGQKLLINVNTLF